MDTEIFQKNEDINILMEDYDNMKKTYNTKNTLTKYEKTRILSERTSQINDGSEIFIDKDKYDNAYNIALEEFKLKKIPFIIKRPYGNHFEYWKIIDLY
jgi:DNA-directed RNA polymerase subunit K/omega